MTDVNVNNGSLSTKGVDMKMNYRWDLTGAGSLAFALEGTKLISLDTQPVTNGPSYDCTGFFGVTCGAPNPSWRHVFNTTWSTPWDGLDVTLRWRYLSSSDSQLDQQRSAAHGQCLAADLACSGVQLHRSDGAIRSLQDDSSAARCQQHHRQGSADHRHQWWWVRVGLPDDHRPNGSSCNGNTFPGTYDALGRFFFAHITAQF